MNRKTAGERSKRRSGSESESEDVRILSTKEESGPELEEQDCMMALKELVLQDEGLLRTLETSGVSRDKIRDLSGSRLAGSYLALRNIVSKELGRRIGAFYEQLRDLPPGADRDAAILKIDRFMDYSPALKMRILGTLNNK